MKKVTPDEARLMLEGLLRLDGDVALAALVNELFAAEEAYFSSTTIWETTDVLLERRDRLQAARGQLAAFFTNAFNKQQQKARET